MDIRLDKPLDQMVLELFEMLESREISNNGHEFSPTQVSTVRVMHSIKLRDLLPAMKRKAYLDQQMREMSKWNL